MCYIFVQSLHCLPWLSTEQSQNLLTRIGCPIRNALDFISRQNTLLVTVTKTTKRQANLLSVIRSDTFYYVVWQHQNPHMTYHMWNSVNYWATIFSPSQIPFYKDTIFIPLLGGIPLCKSHSTSRLCSIHHDIPVTMHTPAAYGQWSVFYHSGDNQSAVLGTRYGIWWPWYGQFEVR